MTHSFRTPGLAVFAFVCTTRLVAQSFTISPNDTVWVSAPLASLSIHDIYQENATGYPIDLAWDSVLVDLPEAWDYSTCDLGHCYPGIPAVGGQMFPVGVGEMGFLGLNLIPNGVAGTGTVQMRVYDMADPGSAVILTWVATAGAVGVDELGGADGIALYPVPAQDRLQVRTSYNTDVQVFDMSGQAVPVAARRSFEGLSLDIAALRPGAYVLVLNNAAGSSRRSFLKQ